jgi:hypothetical protein
MAEYVCEDPMLTPLSLGDGRNVFCGNAVTSGLLGRAVADNSRSRLFAKFALVMCALMRFASARARTGLLVTLTNVSSIVSIEFKEGESDR